MEFGRFVDAARALRRYDESQSPPPPHALARLGRVMLGKGLPREAHLALRLFLRLYPAHQDRADSVADLARALEMMGRKGEAAKVAAEAETLHARRASRRAAQARRDRLLSGHAH